MKKKHKLFSSTHAPKRGKKGTVMKVTKSLRPNSLGIRRATRVALVVSAAFIIAACGGGGGDGLGLAGNPGSVTPPVINPSPITPPVVNPGPVVPPVVTPPATVSGTITGTKSCEVAAGQAKCLAEVMVEVSASATNPSLVIGTSVFPLVSGVQTVSVELQGETNEVAVLKNGNGTVLDNSKSVSSSCATDTLWDSPGVICRAVRYYSDYVVAIWGKWGTPYIVSKNGIVEVVNKTPWQLPAATPFNCGLRKENNPDAWGGIHGSCKDSVSLKQRPFVIDPVTGEYRLSSTIDPNSPDYVVGNTADYVYADEFDPAYPSWGAKARVVDGWYFTPAAINNDTVSLFFLNDNGTQFLVEELSWSDNGNLKVLRTFNHPRP